MPRQSLADRDQVAQGAGHLLLGVAEARQPVVNPEADEGLDAGVALRLRLLVLMMGEDEVLPAAVDVDRLP